MPTPHNPKVVDSNLILLLNDVAAEKRRVFTYQPITRVYNDDLVISNGYTVLSYTDLKGQITTFHTRFSVTWAKVGGRCRSSITHLAPTAGPIGTQGTSLRGRLTPEAGPDRLTPAGQPDR